MSVQQTETNTKQQPKGSGRIVTILLIAGILAAAYHYKNFFIKKYIAPCSTPLTYQVSSLDNRFNISQDKFKQAISDAAKLWDTAAGRQLFQYDAKGEMPISLVYDSRQQSTDELKKLNLSVDSTQSAYNKLASTYKQYLTKYNSDKQQYAYQLQQYNAELQAYNQAVRDWNAKGGAPKDEYATLNAQRDQLNATAQALNTESDLLNKEVDTINALVGNLNRIGTELNINVNGYNAIGKNLNEFEEGVYITDGFSKKIIIYQFDSYNTLVRVLAHELGHSLGMDHVSDPNAIMYKLNQSKNEKPTPNDITELKRVCKF